MTKLRKNSILYFWRRKKTLALKGIFVAFILMPLLLAASPSKAQTAPLTPETEDRSIANCIGSLNKFGFGPTRNQIATLCIGGGDVRGFLQSQNAPSPTPKALDGLLSHQDFIKHYQELSRMNAPGNPQKRYAKQVYEQEMAARVLANATADNQLAERMTHFWSNHFSMYAEKTNLLLGLTGMMERDCIRPNLFKTFPDMLICVTEHPGMLIYLDNDNSVGPHSRNGLNSGAGSNENLAREILELHTLGAVSMYAPGGYTQNDVQELAKVLTGWSYDTDPQGTGDFQINPTRHEPGAVTILGQKYFSTPNSYETAPAIKREGEKVLRYIALQPATAKYIATKLAKHFYGDTVDVETITLLTNTYLATGGDLQKMYAQLINIPKATKLGRKIKTPYETMVGIMRLYGPDHTWLSSDPSKAIYFQQTLGDNLLWDHLTPDGYADTNDVWLTPQSLLRRAEWCPTFLANYPSRPDPLVLLNKTYAGNTLDSDGLVHDTTLPLPQREGQMCILPLLNLR